MQLWAGAEPSQYGLANKSPETERLAMARLVASKCLPHGRIMLANGIELVNEDVETWKLEFSKKGLQWPDVKEEADEEGKSSSTASASTAPKTTDRPSTPPDRSPAAPASSRRISSEQQHTGGPQSPSSRSRPRNAASASPTADPGAKSVTGAASASSQGAVAGRQ